MNSVLFGAVLVVCGATAEAQNATPAGVNETHRQSPINAALVDSAIRPLRLHMVRGAEIGAISGLVGSTLLVVAAASMTGQCYTTPSLDFGGCSEGLSRRKTAQIVTGGTILGGFVGAVLGYTYHTTLEDRHKARCRSAPNECK